MSDARTPGYLYRKQDKIDSLFTRCQDKFLKSVCKNINDTSITEKYG